MKLFFQKHWLRILSLTLLIIAVSAFWSQLSNQWNNLDIDLDTIRWGYVWVSFALFPLVVVWNGIVWRYILAPQDRNKLSIIEALRIHTVYWMTRYIPVAATTLASKTIMGQRLGISRRTLALATVYEQVIQIFSAFGVGIGLTLLAWNLENSPEWMIIATVILFGGVMTSLHPRIFYPFANKALGIFKREPMHPESLLSYSKLLWLMGAYIIGQLGNGIAFFALVKAFIPLENVLIFPFIGFYSLAGVIGVLAIFVPSGLGVREGILVTLLTQFMPLPLAVTISIATRLLQTLSDGLLFIALGIYQWRRYIFTPKVLFGLWSTILFGGMIGIYTQYSGTYIDEYWHIFAGRDWLMNQQFAELYSTGPYDRGMVISVLSGIMQASFGNVLWVQKIIPFGLAIATYISLIGLCRQLWPRRWGIAAFVGALWAFNPWLIFNHQYIRMYSWYEYVFVTGLWITLASTNTSFKKWMAIQISLLVVLVGVYWSAQDPSVLLPIFGIILAQISIFITRSDSMTPLRRWMRITGVGILALGVIVSQWGQRLIERFLTQDFIFATQENYITFFFERNLIVSIFVICGMLIWAVRGTIKQRIIVGVSAILISLHLISSPDVQLIRSIFYLLPVLYLLSTVPIENMAQSRHWIGKCGATILTTVLIFGVYQSYPLDEGYITDGPIFIPNEIFAIEYDQAYQYIQQNCERKTIYETSPTPYLGEFYNIAVDAAVVTQQEWLSIDTIFARRSDGSFEVYYSQVPVISDIEDLDSSFCWVQRTPSLGRYLSVDAINIQAVITDFEGIRVVER